VDLKSQSLNAYRCRGGKSRSIDIPGSGQDGRKDLPGEHGFRFFPGFYRNLPDTMQRIPFGENDLGVFDNLAKATQVLMARGNENLRHIILSLGKDDAEPTEPPEPVTLETICNSIKRFLDSLDIFTEPEIQYMLLRQLEFLNSSNSRRMEVYEKQSWAEFNKFDQLDTGYEKIFNAMTRLLVAAEGTIADARTVQLMIVQLFLGPILEGTSFDRCLNGPSSDAWITPWFNYLESNGVTIILDATLTQFHMQDGEINGFTYSTGGQDVTVLDEFDYYVAAVPTEVMRNLLTQEILDSAPELAGLINLQTEWMTGFQIFLNQDVPVVHGHVIFVESPWALTSISQAQFWDDTDLADYGDGTVRDIISVDISDWEMPGIIYGKKANECTLEEIKVEVVEQIKVHLNRDGDELFKDEYIVDWFLDPAIYFDAEGVVAGNTEPLMINHKDSWQYRPSSVTEIPNLFIAADYVRTNVGLATMEGANEAARHAVNGIISLSDANVTLCEIFPLEEPKILNFPKAIDTFRYSVFGQQHPWGWAADKFLKKMMA